MYSILENMRMNVFDLGTLVRAWRRLRTPGEAWGLDWELACNLTALDSGRDREMYQSIDLAP